MRTVISTDQAPTPGGRYSQAIVSNGFVFTAGQVGIDPATGALAASLAGQVTQAIRNVQTVLGEAGSGLEHVVKTTCFLADINAFAAFDEAYGQLFPAPLPARSTIGVSLAGDLLFEIEVIARIPEPAGN
jgi:2-iminobutanoate/2-iminopropanoate deaminase